MPIGREGVEAIVQEIVRLPVSIKHKASVGDKHFKDLALGVKGLTTSKKKLSTGSTITHFT